MKPKPNPALVASAPALLEAAKLALAVIMDNFPYEHGNPAVGKAWGALEEAIRKAEAPQNRKP